MCFLKAESRCSFCHERTACEFIVVKTKTKKTAGTPFKVTDVNDVHRPHAHALTTVTNTLLRHLLYYVALMCLLLCDLFCVYVETAQTTYLWPRPQFRLGQSSTNRKNDKHHAPQQEREEKSAAHIVRTLTRG